MAKSWYTWEQLGIVIIIVAGGIYIWKKMGGGKQSGYASSNFAPKSSCGCGG